MAADSIAAALSSFNFVIVLLHVRVGREHRDEQRVPIFILKQM
jgi:hypothetical protein